MELIRFEYRRADEEPDETLEVDDDATARRTVTGAGSGAAEIGWWRGTVDASVLDHIRAARNNRAPAAVDHVAPAVGQWWAVLDDRQRPTTADAALAALVSIITTAVSVPETVVSAAGWTETWDDEPAPVVLLRLRCIGDTPGDIRFDDETDAPVAAFVTDEMETLGFLGSTFTVAPPTEATAVVRQRPPTDGRLWLEGTLASAVDADRGLMRFRLIAAVASEPPAE